MSQNEGQCRTMQRELQDKDIDIAGTEAKGKVRDQHKKSQPRS